MRLVTGSEQDVLRIYNPQSVAIIGASSRPGSLSWWPLHLVQKYKFPGAIYPINPNRAEINGLPCYPTLAEVPGPVDVAVIALNANQVLDAVRDCAARGVKAVVLPTQGLSELGAEGKAKEQEILRVAKEAGMRIVGANTDGLGSIGKGALLTIQPLFDAGIQPGNIGVVTQSGATAGSLLARLHKEGLGCRYYAAAGNEVDLGLADYLSVMVQDPDVTVILSFVESIRRPDDFVAVAKMAAELGKPIALIKVGRSEQGAQRAAAHTGSLTGADAVYDAVFRDLGIIRVSELGELVAVAKLFLSCGAPSSKGVGIISVSGGQAGTAADKAVGMGLAVPAISPETEVELNKLLEFGKAFNPCDVTGQVAVQPDLVAKVYAGFAREQEIAGVVYARKHLLGTVARDAAVALAAEAKAPGVAPLAIYAMDAQILEAEREIYRENEIPCFDSLHDLYAAFGALADYSAFQRRRTESAGLVKYEAKADRPSLPAGENGMISEVRAREILARYGLFGPKESLVPSEDAAVAAAKEIGFPVAMKVVSDRIPHKTEAGVVALRLGTEAEVRAAYQNIIGAAEGYLGTLDIDGVLVQEQIEEAVELIAGVKVDPNFGPFIMVGSGGIFTEVLKDVALRPAPLEPAQVVEMLGELRGSVLLHGFRGRPKADVAALAEAVAGLSRLACDYRDEILEIDVNPIMVLPEGRSVRVVDALIVRR